MTVGNKIDTDAATAGSPTTPSLGLDAGTTFGYRSGPAYFRKEHRLVEVKNSVSVGPGLHLFVAPNGAGKTTFLRTVARLSPPIAGSPRVHGRVLYQSDELRADPQLTPKTLFKAMFKGAGVDRAFALSDEWKLNLSTPIGKFSRGNRQKVLLILLEARLVGGRKSIVLMDEPLTGLDADTRAVVVDYWARSTPDALRLVVLHELESVREADSLFTISAGELRHITDRGANSWSDTYRSL